MKMMKRNDIETVKKLGMYYKLRVSGVQGKETDREAGGETWKLPGWPRNCAEATRTLEVGSC